MTNVEDDSTSRRIKKNVLGDKVRSYYGSSSILRRGVVGDDIIGGGYYIKFIKESLYSFLCDSPAIF